MIKLIRSNDKPTVDFSEYYGLAADVPNLPTNTPNSTRYITTGSVFFCIDTTDVYVFEEESNQWYRITP